MVIVMKAYLFDLGGVLAGFDHLKFCHRLSERAHHWSPEEIYRIVFQAELNDRFETGSIRGEEFYQILCSTLKLTIPQHEFREIWCDIFQKNPGMETLLEALHNQARLVLISNTNYWHVEYIREKFTFLEHFDALIFSYEIGVRKPDPRIFRAALDAAGTSSDQCLYFDDLEGNIRAANRLGIPSVLFRFSPP